MSKRLNVEFDEREYREIKRAARRRGLSLSDWVRQTLAEARTRATQGDADRKREALREAVQHSFPTAEVEEMIREIEQGYRTAE
jgi:negative regulator of replication initiation